MIHCSWIHQRQSRWHGKRIALAHRSQTTCHRFYLTILMRFHVQYVNPMNLNQETGNSSWDVLSINTMLYNIMYEYTAVYLISCVLWHEVGFHSLVFMQSCASHSPYRDYSKWKLNDIKTRWVTVQSFFFIIINCCKFIKCVFPWWKVAYFRSYLSLYQNS